MGLLDIFKQKNSVPEKVKTCEKTDSGANMVKEIREEILQKTAIPCMKLELTETKPSLFDSKVGGIGYVPHDAKIPEDSKGVQLRLLAQIDCAEITLEDFPHQGLLQFWILNDDVSGLTRFGCSISRNRTGQSPRRKSAKKCRIRLLMRRRIISR